MERPEKAGMMFLAEKGGTLKMVKLLIIADDFTGALDTGVQFSACGADVRVMAGPEACTASLPDCEVLVVNAETRHLPPEQAYQTVAGIVAQARELAVPHIYKKTDSALRGNIGAELAALLEASGEPWLPFLPAFPQMGRVTRGGVHYIGDVPVAESVFGRDPFEPVRCSRVVELIRGQCSLPVESRPPLAGGSPPAEAEGITVFDAATLEDLRQTGECLLREGRLSVIAGCAGFGAVIPELLGLGNGRPAVPPPLDPRLLVICGSVNPITTAQLDRAEQAGFLRIRLSPEQKLEPDYWLTGQGAAEFGVLQDILRRYDCRIIETNDFGGNGPTAGYAAARGMTIEDVRTGISRSVGYMVSRLFSCPALGTLLVTGGDTLLQCMDYMGAQELQPLCELEPGVVLSRFVYQGCTRYVISKSGGFGGEELIEGMPAKLAATHKARQNKEDAS